MQTVGGKKTYIIPMKLISIMNSVNKFQCLQCQCVHFSPARPNERYCAWTAVWSHLTAGTSAGWWELHKGKHACIKEIKWSADYRLPAEAYGSSLLFLGIFIKLDNGNTGGGEPFQHQNKTSFQTLTEENKTHKDNKKKKKKHVHLFKTAPTYYDTETLKEECFNMFFFFLSSLFHGMLLSPRGESLSYSGN